MNCAVGLPHFLCWLSGGLDPLHQLPAAYAWHGRLMVLAWSILLPLGTLIARYYKIMPSQAWPEVLDNQRWWQLHLLLQIAGIVCMAIALTLMWSTAGVLGFASSLHAGAGWLVVALACLQVAGGVLRGSKGGPTDACCLIFSGCFW